MDSTSLAFHRKDFKIAFLSKKGAAFQDWFAELAEFAWGSDFEAARHYGRQGDWKCDGRRRSTGTIFQCYAPDSMKVREMIGKIDTDLSGAVEKWPDFIKGWVLVHNDKRGLPSEVLAHLDLQRKKYPSLVIDNWGEAQLFELFGLLSLSARNHLFGPAPTIGTVHSITLEDLEAVITTLEGLEPDLDAIMPPPPSEQKLNKNALSIEARELLQIGRFKARMVETYFKKSANVELGERIAKSFRRHYAELRARELSPDQILGGLQEFAGVSGEPKRQAAAMSVLMYFFDRCDIFEDPDEPGVEEP